MRVLGGWKSRGSGSAWAGDVGLLHTNKELRTFPTKAGWVLLSHQAAIRAKSDLVDFSFFTSNFSGFVIITLQLFSKHVRFD